MDEVGYYLADESIWLLYSIKILIEINSKEILLIKKNLQI